MQSIIDAATNQTAIISTVIDNLALAELELPELYRKARMYGNANTQAANLDSIGQSWLDWHDSQPATLSPSATVTTATGLFRSSVRFNTSKRFRDISNHGQCKPSLPDSNSKKARGMKAAYIRTVFTNHLQGRDQHLAIAYFIDGLTAAAIALDLNITRQAVTKQIKRLTVRLTSNQAIADALSQFFDDSIAQTFSLTESMIIDLIDRHDKRHNITYTDVNETISDIDATIARRRKYQALKRT